MMNKKSKLRTLYTEPHIYQINPAEDYIRNGNFSINSCPNSFCIYNIMNYSNQVPYWSPLPQIQIGNGPIYSVNIIGSRVMQLGGSHPSCIYQEINHLPAGFYKIWIQYKARSIGSLLLNKFGVYFGIQKLVSFIPPNYQLNVLELFTEIIQNHTNSFIKICSQRTDNVGSSAVIVHVKVLRYAYHGTIQIIHDSIEKNQRIINQSLNILCDIFSASTTITTLSIPGIRYIFKNLFLFFIQLDHIWLYIYHQRQNGPFMALFFDSIHQIKSEKWAFFSNTFNLGVYQNYVSSLQQNLDKKYPYQSKNFMHIRIVDNPFHEYS